MMTAIFICFLVGYYSEVNKKEPFDLPFSFYKVEPPEEEIVIEESNQTEDWDAICQMAIQQAKNGDHRARDWVVKHMCGDGESTDINTSSSETSPVKNNQDKIVVEEAISTLHNAGYNKAEAKKIISELVKGRTYDSVEELIKDVFSQRQPKSV
tara:strand:- start:374 stop:835 length:462 start_codon:yes stop_codon:yes gene_type:complete